MKLFNKEEKPFQNCFFMINKSVRFINTEKPLLKLFNLQIKVMKEIIFVFI